MLVHGSSTSEGRFPTTSSSITWGTVSHIFLGEQYMKKVLIQLFAFFIFFVTSNHFDVKQWRNSETDENSLIMALQGVVFYHRVVLIILRDFIPFIMFFPMILWKVMKYFFLTSGTLYFPYPTLILFVISLQKVRHEII